MERIVLAYSGRVESSVAIRWLAETHRAEIVAVTLDVGQREELDALRERALAVGAVRSHVLDLRDEFARDFILPALQAGAIFDGDDPLAAALARLVMARHLVQIARIEGASAVAHVSLDADGDVQMDAALRSLEPALRVHAPASEWHLSPREIVEYARRCGIPAPSVDTLSASASNLWGRSLAWTGGSDSWSEAPEDIFLLTKSAAESPDTPALVEIEFRAGAPVGINGVSMSLVEAIQSLETIAGAHGVGRLDTVDNRPSGPRSRRIYEAPAAVALHVGHRALRQMVTPPDLERLLADLGVRYADLVRTGRWFSPTRTAIDALVAKVQENVTGVVRLKLFKGGCHVVGRTSPHAASDATAASSVNHAGKASTV